MIKPTRDSLGLAAALVSWLAVGCAQRTGDGEMPTTLYRGEDNTRDSAGSLHATESTAEHAVGRVGQGFSFDAAGRDDGQHVVLPPEVGDFGSHDFTITLWMNTTDAGGVQAVFSKRASCWGGPTFAGWDLRMGPAGNLHLELWSTAGYFVLRAPPGLNDGRWHHLAIVREGGTVGLRVDGDVAASHGFAGSMNDLSQTPTYLGVDRCVPGAPGSNGNQDGTRWFRGRLDELGFYPRALSAAELRAMARDVDAP